MTGDADVADESSTPRGGTLGVSPVVPTYPIRNNAGVSIEVLEYQRRMHAISLNLYSNSDKESKEFGDEKKKKKEIWPKWLSSYRNRQQRGKSTETRKLIIASLGTLSFWFWSSCLFNVTPGGGICTSLIPSIDLRRDGSSNWGGSPPPTQQAEQVPDFVMEYAPYVYLYSGETFWPCNIGEQYAHPSSL